MTCPARKRFSPSSSKNASSLAWVRPSRFTLAVSVMLLPCTLRGLAGSAGAGAQLGFGKEVADFTGSGRCGVGAMYGVGVDGLGEVGTDGTGSGFLGVGGAHQFAVLQYRTLAFQHLNHNRAGGHEADQILEEGAFLVLGVEAFSVGLGQLNHLGSDDAQTGLLETGQDLADHVLGNGVGLDDGQGAFYGHETLQSLKNGWTDNRNC